MRASIRNFYKFFGFIFFMCYLCGGKNKAGHWLFRMKFDDEYIYLCTKCAWRLYQTKFFSWQTLHKFLQKLKKSEIERYLKRMKGNIEFRRAVEAYYKGRYKSSFL
jgi:hypothetical protein